MRGNYNKENETYSISDMTLYELTELYFELNENISHKCIIADFKYYLKEAFYTSQLESTGNLTFEQENEILKEEYKNLKKDFDVIEDENQRRKKLIATLIEEKREQGILLREINLKQNEMHNKVGEIIEARYKLSVKTQLLEAENENLKKRIEELKEELKRT